MRYKKCGGCEFRAKLTHTGRGLAADGDDEPRTLPLLIPPRVPVVFNLKEAQSQ